MKKGIRVEMYKRVEGRRGICYLRARLRRSVLCLALVVSLFSFPLFASAPFSQLALAGVVSTETREGRLAVFDDVWETIRDRYYDPAFHGVDWQAQRALFRPLVAEATSAAMLYSLLRRMIGNLRDAHTRIRTPDEKFDWQHPRAISVGLSVREVEGAPVVVAVERGSEAERL